MAGPRTRIPPTYADAKKEYWYQAQPSPVLLRKFYSREFEANVMGDNNLLDDWPKWLSIGGQQWPFLNVVYLMSTKRWPTRPLAYPFPRCDPAQIIER